MCGILHSIEKACLLLKQIKGCSNKQITSEFEEECERILNEQVKAEMFVIPMEIVQQSVSVLAYCERTKLF
jgi:hypothetical protein